MCVCETEIHVFNFFPLCGARRGLRLLPHSRVQKVCYNRHQCYLPVVGCKQCARTGRHHSYFLINVYLKDGEYRQVGGAADAKSLPGPVAWLLPYAGAKKWARSGSIPLLVRK